MGPLEKQLSDKLNLAFQPAHLELINESPQHGLPASAEKHFRLVLVTPHMAGLSRIERHRLVNELLATELRAQVHALSIQAFTPEEWEKRSGQTFASPECQHARKN